MPIEYMTLGSSAPTGEPCTTGNINTPSLVASELVAPLDEYRVVFDPTTGCDRCAIGFGVNTIRVIFYIETPCDISFSVNLSEIDDSNPSCPRPGTALCDSGNFSASLPMAGFWDIGVSITCSCYAIDRFYLLGVKITSANCSPVPGLVVDTMPSTCRNWFSDGGAWTDLVATAGLPGNFMLYADADCCGAPVAAESKTWGAIKDLYRNQ